jgi:hypothetical protein
MVGLPLFPSLCPPQAADAKTKAKAIGSGNGNGNGRDGRIGDGGFILVSLGDFDQGRGAT